MKRVPLGSILGGAAVISLLTIAARAAGFARWAVFSPAVGSTAVGSAYTAANALPNVLFEVAAGGALAGIVVPLVARPIARRAQGEVNAIASALLTWTLTILIPLSGLLAVLARPITRAVMGAGPQADGVDIAELAARLLQMFAPQVPLYGIGVVAAGLLQAGHRFFWPSLAPLASSCTVILVYAAYWRLSAAPDQLADVTGGPLALLGWGTTAGVAVLTVPLLVPLHRQGVRFRFSFRFPPGTARRALALAGAGLAALAAQQLAIATVVVLASQHGSVGALPLYHYAQAVYLLPYAVLAVPLSLAAFPHLSRFGADAVGGRSLSDAVGGRSLSDAAQQRSAADRLRHLTATSTQAVTAAGLLGASILFASAPAIETVFSTIDRAGQAVGLGNAVAAFAPGLVGFALLTHLQRVLYAAHRPKAATIAATVAWSLVAGLSIILVLAALGGQTNTATTLLALSGASSIGMTVGGAAGLIAVRSALGSGALAGLARSAPVLAVGAALGGLSGRMLALNIAPSGAVSALGTVLLAALVAAIPVALAAVIAPGFRQALAATIRRQS